MTTQQAREQLVRHDRAMAGLARVFMPGRGPSAAEVEAHAHLASMALACGPLVIPSPAEVEALRRRAALEAAVAGSLRRQFTGSPLMEAPLVLSADD